MAEIKARAKAKMSAKKRSRVRAKEEAKKIIAEKPLLLVKVFGSA